MAQEQYRRVVEIYARIKKLEFCKSLENSKCEIDAIDEKIHKLKKEIEKL